MKTHWLRYSFTSDQRRTVIPFIRVLIKVPERESFSFHSSLVYDDLKNTNYDFYLIGDLFMDYRRNNGTPMSRQEALNDTCRRQNQELRNSKTSAERCDIQRRYAAERQNIMKNYK